MLYIKKIEFKSFLLHWLKCKSRAIDALNENDVNLSQLWVL